MKITKLNVSNRRKITFYCRIFQYNTQVYLEDSSGYWWKNEYDKNHMINHSESSTGNTFDYE